MQLSTEQQNALDAFKNSKNIFLTGPGGSGKSELIRQMVSLASERGLCTQVCALTGCATVLLNCKGVKTIHAWSGIGLAKGPQGTIVDKVAKNKQKKKPWSSVDVLIIDEVSMMSQKIFEILDRIGKKVRKNPNQPFGGIQLVFSGDFYQLPPVSNSNDCEMSTFCFESTLWNETFNVIIELRKIFRQSDPVYAKILNQIRIGKLNKSGNSALLNRVGKQCKDELLKPTILLPRKKDVDRVNAKELSKLNTEEMTFAMCVTKDPQHIPVYQNSEQEDWEIKYLQGSIMADETIVLKIGTQVMCVANIDTESSTPLVNGSQGIVVGFEQNKPVVNFNNGETRILGTHTWYSDNLQHIGIKQIPLIHAWAITIHKAQGVTLDLAEIDAGSNIFECGQTYVALSRVRNLDGLFLKSFDYTKIKVNRKVRKFYETMSVSPLQV